MTVDRGLSGPRRAGGPPNAEPITDASVRVLLAIAQLQGRAIRPTMPLLAELLHRSRSTIHHHVTLLEAQGLVRRGPAQSNGTLVSLYEITHQGVPT